MDTEPPKIVIQRVNSDDSRKYEERLKELKYEILPPNEFELKVCKKAAQYLNGYRMKYANKEPIPEEYIKLRIIGGTGDLNDVLEGVKLSDGHSAIGGFVDSATGELYLAGNHRDEPLEFAHILVHEMTHFFTGEVGIDSSIFSHTEAATELVATEILAKIMAEDFDGLGIKEKDGSVTTIKDEDAILKLLEEHYQSYKGEIEELKNQTDDFEDIKQELFSAKDYVKWGYNEHYNGNT